MLWLLPVFIKTVLGLFGCPIGGVFSFLNSVIYSVSLFCLVPAYFVYAGPEEAVRFSFILCVHSLLLAALPRFVKVIVPMLELILFALLLFLPISVPPLMLWLYEKLLCLSSPFLAVSEVIHVVTVIMKTSQTAINHIEEYPKAVKFIILFMASLATLLGSTLCQYICLTYPKNSIIMIVEILAVTSAILFILSLVKEEGIISDVPCIFCVMMCIVWALAHEKALRTTSIEAPEMWNREIPKQLSFFGIMRNMITNGLTPLYKIKILFIHLISPPLLLMTGVRIISLGHVLSEAKRKLRNEYDDENSGEDEEFDINKSRDVDNDHSDVFISRFLLIFVLTESLLRAVFTVTSSTSTSSYPSNGALGALEFWWREITGLFTETLFDFRHLRVLQLCLLVVVYVYRLFCRHDVIDTAG